MLLLDIQDEISEERRGRLKSQLRELERAAWLAGNPAVLYCSVCEATVSSQNAMDGPVRDWPYCPVHGNTPLTIRPALPREMKTVGY
jgi:hypothetical protein